MGKTKKRTVNVTKDSKKDRIISHFFISPLSTPEEAARILGRGITPGYVKRVLRDNKDAIAQNHPKGFDKKEAKNSPAFDEGQLRGGNGRTDYSIKGVSKHEGPVDGLPNMTMQVMIVDGDAAANVREAQAFVSSIRAVLSGLEKVEKEMDNPELLGFHILQVTNIMNAATRIRDQLLTTFEKRKEDHKKFVDRTKTELPEDERTEWVSSFHPVEGQKAEAPAAE